MWREGNTCALLVGMQIDTATKKNSIEVPQRSKNRTTTLFINPTSEYMAKGNENKISKRYLYSLILCRIIHNSQDKETTYKFVN